MVQRILSRLRPSASAVSALGGAAIAIVFMIGFLALNPPGGKYTDADIQRLAQERVDSITPTPPLEPEIYALLRPSVVLITRDGVDEDGPQGIGSGVVVDLNGSILTAYHVVAGARTVDVHFFDGSTITGTIGQTQPDRDLAVINVRNLPQGVEAATLSGGARPGDEVLAIGAPGGFDGTVTSGIVSAVGRRFTVEATGQTLENLIQFDAAINPGNSGGPLVDLNGRVIGIISSRIDQFGDRPVQGIGFAVPIEAASGIFAPLG